jgi:hypothetical protein
MVYLQKLTARALFTLFQRPSAVSLPTAVFVALKYGLVDRVRDIPVVPGKLLKRFQYIFSHGEVGSARVAAEDSPAFVEP